MTQFETALATFIETANEIRKAGYDKNFYENFVNDVEIAGGRKFVKLTEQKNGRVYGFVNKENGDIYMAATYKAPVKVSRGNIYKNEGKDALASNGSIRYANEKRYVA